MDTKWKSIDWKGLALTFCYFAGVTLFLFACGKYFGSLFAPYPRAGRMFSVALWSFFIAFCMLVPCMVFGLKFWFPTHRHLAEFFRKAGLPYKMLAVMACLISGIDIRLLVLRTYTILEIRDLPVVIIGWAAYLTVVDIAFNIRFYKKRHIPFLKDLFLQIEPTGDIRKKRALLLTVSLLSVLALSVLSFFLLNTHSDRSVITFFCAAVIIYLWSAVYDSTLDQWHQAQRWARFQTDLVSVLDGALISELDPEYSGMPICKKIASLRAEMEQALQDQIASERTKADLITNVSHDLKTPITSLISYIEFLKREEDLSPAARDYVLILEKKADRLNSMVQDVFDISKAVSGQLPIEPEDMDLRKLLEQTLADLSERISESACPLRAVYPENAVRVHTDGGRMYRVFQNLIVNALQYSLPGSRIFLTLTSQDGRAAVRVCNTSRDEISPDVDYSERFFRGDSSRSTSGSGLGLSIAKTFTERCGGSFSITVEGDWFTACVSLPVISEPNR